jgi:hypothetical protein
MTPKNIVYTYLVMTTSFLAEESARAEEPRCKDGAGSVEDVVGGDN